MTVFIAILLTVVAFALVIYPLLKQRLTSADSTEGEEIKELQSQRDTSYSMLKELEFDFQSGILSREDYEELEARYKRKAISILRDIDHLQSGEDLEEEIEGQILRLRQSKGHFCPKCGASYQERDNFCSSCGTRIRQGEDVD